jgi:hypothetical protein
MKTYTTDELKEILRLHRLWRIDEEGGSRADLCGAVLCGAVLRDAVLCGADLRDADLCGADLCGAVLCGAVLRDAVLCGADLRDADLRGADLRDADLRGAVLCGADLSRAVLSRADLRGAVLSCAVLSRAVLSRANLRGADLRGAIGLPIATDAPARLLAVAQAALASPNALAMGAWHTCETTHCICGWAEHLGGPLANLIIQTQGNDLGGLMLLGVEAHAHFYKNNDDARAFLQSVIDGAEGVA